MLRQSWLLTEFPSPACGTGLGAVALGEPRSLQRGPGSEKLLPSAGHPGVLGAGCWCGSATRCPRAVGDTQRPQRPQPHAVGSGLCPAPLLAEAGGHRNPPAEQPGCDGVSVLGHPKGWGSPQGLQRGWREAPGATLVWGLLEQKHHRTKQSFLINLLHNNNNNII